MSELGDMEGKYSRLLAGEDVDFSEADLSRLYVLRQDQANSRRSILAEVAAKNAAVQLRGMSRIKAALQK